MRGRRVINVSLMLFVICSWLLVKQTHAQIKSISTTTTVSVSPAWKKTIENYSQVEIDSKPTLLNIPIRMRILSKGPENEFIPNQKIRINIYYNSLKLQNYEILTNNHGETGFAFVPTKYGTYQIFFENITYDKAIPFKSIYFSLEKPSFIEEIIAGIPFIK